MNIITVTEIKEILMGNRRNIEMYAKHLSRRKFLGAGFPWGVKDGIVTYESW